MSEPAAEFDGAWKEALDGYFRPFTELLFPDLAEGIDWSREVEPLDAELQKIAPEAEVGRGSVDKLVRVWTVTGLREDVLVHVEIQSQHDPAFPRRMYRYNHRLEDRYGRMPVSLAVLGDEDRWWWPSEFQAGWWRCHVKFHFPMVKLVDYLGRERELEESPNPFAVFVLAHLKTLETRGKPDSRRGWKLRITKGLYDRGLEPTEVRKLFRLIDWVMALPPPTATEFARDLAAFEQERQMRYVTQTEQFFLDQATAKDRAELTATAHAGIELGLKLRFGAGGVALMPRVRAVADKAALDGLIRDLETVPDLAAFAALLPPQA